MDMAEKNTPAPASSGGPSGFSTVSREMLWSALRDGLPAILAPVLGIAVALGITILILKWQGADPKIAWDYVYEGTLETPAKRADLTAFWMPLAITSLGLVLTFTAGLWNIGVEGQVIMGAIGATWAVRGMTGEGSNIFFQLNKLELFGAFLAGTVLVWNGVYLFRQTEQRRLWYTGLVMLLVTFYVGLMWLQVVLRELGASVLLIAFISAALFGAGWASVAAALKTRGGVNEIFGGVALNFIAQTFTMYLISNGGPWQPPGSRATETARFPESARLVTFEEYRRLSPTTIYITIGAFAVVAFIMLISRWGLQLRAMGNNQKSAFLLGVRTERNVILSMALCGSMAGIGGAYRVLAPDVAKLNAAPSGGIGFLAILVVLLASSSVLLVPFVSFAFAVLSKGGQRMENGFAWDHDLELDRSLVRVLQSTMVLMVVLAFGVRNRFFPPRATQPVDEDDDIART